MNRFQQQLGALVISQIASKDPVDAVVMCPRRDMAVDSFRRAMAYFETANLLIEESSHARLEITLSMGLKLRFMAPDRTVLRGQRYDVVEDIAL